MKFIKTLLASIALLVAASSANAAQIETYGVISAGSYDYENSYTATGTPFSFEDTVTFTLTDSFFGSFGAGALNFTVGSTNRRFIENLTHSLYNVTTDTLVDSGADFTVSLLTAGDYKIVITGLVTGTKAGEYAGGFTISPVPEPSSVAMLLIGFAALGAIARRRKTL